MQVALLSLPSSTQSTGPTQYSMNTTPTPEDRVWSVLAHLSALSFGMGILLPVVGWSDQRRKSNYASFQCLQALGYQSVGFTVWALSYLLIVILGAIVLLVALQPDRASSDILSPGLIVFFLDDVSGQRRPFWKERTR